ncbi:peptidoglycan/xylan/chitin deacetylase (PgdA/CDA1 family) [Christiangramia gaetbulicola]|uniref:Peptidoglycan/xylan/chitin deacetylase (PgdA/CDA1 family) n=1 Tax=Christiangramia gaetbulicola TaxID=703340 RepID=A0A2T6AL17_9FLAO|nr:polysaccharide deacetylase family protein [Christiangramia gaetbulicola]PTX44514.1 peptidoglycan/xylan/chitin deacetylase (PgdA/CDA1 family) [Christiangramia gaetbulicola]
MKLFRAKYPSFLKLLFPERLTHIEDDKGIYLTFDDGPVQEATPWVLDLLGKHEAKATFFCIGDNVKKHPDIFRRIIEEGHGIGNHTFNHLNGWKTSESEYLENTQLAEKIMTETGKQLKTNNSKLQTPNYSLFRPPYGKIKNSQAKSLKEQGYKIVMWDVISGDYDREFSGEECLENVIENATPGSTIVLHDSKKAFKNLKVILPQILDHYKEKGLEFRSLKGVL